jgi:GDP/UDP-N,N'-diacetylbacillosamine 2-epimerase (hydrolysing)
MNSSKFKKKILFISGSRAEYGLLKDLIKSLKKEKKIYVSLIVTGSHLLKKFGKTINEINKDKIKVFRKIKIYSKTNNPKDISISSIKIINGLSNIFAKNKMDLLVVLGDRYEIFLSCYVATLFKVPIAHICGGEETIGSYDNQFRHAITKMSHIHFVTNNFYKKKVIRMGENKENIFNVGSLAFSNYDKLEFKNKFELEKKYKIKFRKENFLVTIHPETLDTRPFEEKLKIIFNVFKKFQNFSFIFTAANSDQGGNEINKMIKIFIKNSKNTYFINSFGQEDYFSMIKVVSGLIGNSSSGIIEAPYFKKGSINLGKRQSGRISSRSVLNIDYNKKDLKREILTITSKKFQSNIKNILSPYYKKNTIENIKRVLIKTKLDRIILKSFNFK